MDSDKLYRMFTDVGLNYSGPFRALDEIKRRHNFCTGMVDRLASRSQQEALIIHPGLLDPAFQAVMASWSWPGDGRMWTLYLPASIRRVRVNPVLAKRNTTETRSFPFNASIEDSPANEIRGDVDIFVGHRKQAFVQVEGLSQLTIADALPSDDRIFFTKTAWGVASPNGELVVDSKGSSQQEEELALACERVAYYYWRRLDNVLTQKDRDKASPQMKRLLSTMKDFFSTADKGKHPFVSTGWEQDNEEVINGIVHKYEEIYLHNRLKVPNC
jgi:hybrid polyketide synthase/nonribosomal peptide synthetase ACE1